MNGRKGKRTLTINNEVRGVKRKKKIKVDEYNSGHQSSIKVIDLSDSEKNTTTSRHQKFFSRRKVNQELRNQKNLRSNCFEMNGTFINQLLEENVTTYQEIGIQENPNQIFLLEDFNIDDSDDLESNCEPTGETEQSSESFDDSINLDSDSEQEVDKETSDKFTGISKIVRVCCSMCKISLENVDDNYLRYLKICLKCQSSLLFQCRKCTRLYKHFQSIWDHVKRSCKSMEINPSIRELALKASDHSDSSREKTSSSDQTPTVITLDSDSEKEENNDDFVNLPIKMPIWIRSIESMCNVEEKSTDSQPVVNDINTQKITSNDTATSSKSKNSKHEDLYYKCHKCEFNAESAKEVKNHIASVHLKNNSKSEYCSKCRHNGFKSLEKHKQKCCGKIRYNCKFCQQHYEVLFALKKHLIAKHSQLFKWYEMDGIMMEIKLKRKAAKEMFLNASKQNKLKNSNEVSKIGDDVDKKIEKLSKINELLRIRCCKCKVTFEKVEEKIILRCPECQSELLYRCRLCDKLFAFFDEAWLHISYKCKSLQNRKGNDTQSTSKITKVPEIPKVIKPSQPAYNCSHCDYTTSHKCQIRQHLKMWHSHANGDLEINFTACSRCGIKFENPEDCKSHEELQCERWQINFPGLPVLFESREKS